jgi:hypothetical protein
MTDLWVIDDETSSTPWAIDSGDGTFAGGVLLTCEPTDLNVFDALGGFTRYQFNGMLAHGKDEIVQVRYPAIIDPTIEVLPQPFPDLEVDIGVTNLDDLLKSYASGVKITVAGHSLGSVIIGRWLENHADDVDAPDPADVRFVQCGNPERKYGGVFKEFHTTPTDTGYTVTDIRVQYDGFADWPDTLGGIAVANAVLGLVTNHAIGYLGANPNNPKNLKHVEGGTTFVLIPAAPPLEGGTLFSSLLGGIGSLLGSFDPLRQQIEASYNRPENIALGSTPVV